MGRRVLRPTVSLNHCQASIVVMDSTVAWYATRGEFDSPWGLHACVVLMASTSPSEHQR